MNQFSSETIYGYYVTAPGTYYRAIMPHSHLVVEYFDYHNQIGCLKHHSDKQVMCENLTKVAAEEYVAKFGGFVESYEIPKNALNYSDKFNHSGTYS